MTLIAMMLLTLVATRVNTQISTITDVSQGSKYDLLATSLAESKIELASNKAFDEKTANSSVSVTSSLTAVSALGKDGTGEALEADYNDFDDYNGYNVTDSTTMSIPFVIQCKVTYVNPLSGGAAAGTTPVSSPTWSKCLTVKVFSPKYMRDTITMTVVNSYWKFR